MFTGLDGLRSAWRQLANWANTLVGQHNRTVADAQAAMLRAVGR